MGMMRPELGTLLVLFANMLHAISSVKYNFMLPLHKKFLLLKALRIFRNLLAFVKSRDQGNLFTLRGFFYFV